MSRRGLPGLRFERVASTDTRVLPRMDVVGLVGFATSGPVDLPVPVENTGAFEALFGPDLKVMNGRRSYLGAAVRAFFANGGKRVVVVRVAGEGLASARFDLPGVLPVGGERPRLLARSPGSWADGISVSTRPRIRALKLLGMELECGADGCMLQGTLPRQTALLPGELLVFRVGSQRVMGPVLEREDVLSGPSRIRVGPLVSAGFAPSPLGAAMGLPFEARVQSAEEEWAVALVSAAVVMVGTTARLQAVAPRESPVQWGDRLRFWVGTQEVSALVDAASLAEEGWVVEGDAQVQDLPSPLVAPLLLPVDAEIYSFDLWVRSGSFRLSGMEDLGFHPLHPRYWRNLPDDSTLYGATPWNAFQKAVAEPRLAVAGTPLSTGSIGPLDWEVPDFADAPPWCAAEVTGPAWTRDGMSSFPVDAFLDGELKECGMEALPALANDILSLRPESRSLRGLHAFWTVEEVTALALPDLYQAPWRMEGGGAVPSYTLSPPPTEFQPCGPEALTAPRWLAFPSTAAVDSSLSWTTSKEAVYRVERASVADFGDALLVQLSTSNRLSVDTTRPSVFYLRVRAERAGRVGPWSRSLRVEVPPGPTLVDTEESVVPTLQQTLRFCAARGDLVAMLATPLGEETEMLALVQSLRSWSEGGALGGNERRALSYGAVFGPWLWVREATGLRAVPPDGALLGLLARKEAWLAIGNLPLAGIVGCTRTLRDATAEQWLQEGLLPLRTEPRGTVALGTYLPVDADSEVQHLNVRRLLTLLRRVAFRYGQDWVFEPQNAAFVRGVRSSMEAVLRRLYEGGAFTGDRPEYGYRVDVFPGDNGRFVVELRVAPSLPLRFLTVRLVQDELRGLALEGA